MTPIRSLHGQGELLAHLPYQLGVTPGESVVVAGFDARNRLVVTLRLDPPGEDQSAKVCDLFAHGRLHSLSHATVVLVGADPHILVGALVVRDALEGNGIHVTHIHSVDYEERSWHTDMCRCGECPMTRSELPAAHRIGAVLDAAVRGIDPSLTRAQLEQRCRPTARESQIADAVREDLEAPRNRPAEAGALALLVDPVGPVPTDPEVLAAATNAVQDAWVRDALLHWLRPEIFPSAMPFTQLLGPDGPASPEEHLRPSVVARLVRWACRVPADHAVPIWTCVAAAEWARGGGALATIALDAALHADPDYKLALLVSECLVAGVLPSAEGPPPAA